MNYKPIMLCVSLAPQLNNNTMTVFIIPAGNGCPPLPNIWDSNTITTIQLNDDNLSKLSCGEHAYMHVYVYVCVCMHVSIKRKGGSA